MCADENSKLFASKYRADCVPKPTARSTESPRAASTSRAVSSSYRTTEKLMSSVTKNSISEFKNDKKSLSPNSFHEQMARLKQENSTIRDDIIKFRESLQVNRLA